MAKASHREVERMISKRLKEHIDLHIDENRDVLALKEEVKKINKKQDTFFWIKVSAGIFVFILFITGNIDINLAEGLARLLTGF